MKRRRREEKEGKKERKREEEEEVVKVREKRETGRKREREEFRGGRRGCTWYRTVTRPGTSGRLTKLPGRTKPASKA